MKTYRVFVTRHYVAVDHFDIEADKPSIAKQRAEAAARQRTPDARTQATDNGWIGDNPVEIERPGYWAHGTHEMIEIRPGVFHTKEN